MTGLVSVLILAIIIAVVFTAIKSSQRSSTDFKKEIIVPSAEKPINQSKKDFTNEVAQLDIGVQTIDTYTQLLTRHSFNTELDKTIAQARKTNHLFALALLRLIPAKNTTITRHILVEAAHRIKNTIRDTDMACYYEKDDFLILFTKMIKPEVIVHGVERIINELHRPYISHTESIAAEVNVHAGITIYPFDGEDPITLLANTTETLEKIKTYKKNLFQFFQDETQVLGERELMLKSALESADLFNHVVFEYKPYYDIKKDEIACIHVVASLKHPELGTIPYNEFLRFAHYSSRLFELYEWMMESAILKFSKSSAMTSKPKRFIFSFYLRQFEIPNFLDKIINIIQGLSSPENEIILEIEDEEDFERSHLDAFKNAIFELNQSNIPISIGILVLGHFALNKLNAVQFRYLKIDQKLVNDLDKRPESIAILEEIMMLAYVMQVETLTTGVTTQEQVTILENLGCKIVQGKYFDKNKSESLFIESELTE